MPRCLMAKKWKAYPWPDRQDDDEETEICNVETVQEKRKMAVEMEDEEIDVVGDSTSEGNRANQQTCWGPHSPTAGTTAPSPPPLNASGALYYNGYNHETWLNHDEPPKYATLRSAAELAEPTSESSSEYYDQQQQSTSPLSPLQNVSRVQSRTKSLSMCFTSTGAALSLPPKKKDIYRPYSLQTNMEVLRTSPEEELSAAQAILDLSASPITASNSVFLHSLSLPPASSNSSIQSNTSPSEPTPIPVSVQLPVPSHNVSNKQDRNSDSLPSDNDKLYPNNTVNNNNLRNNKTVAYTYEAFFVSDGRSKRRSNSVTVPEKETIQSDKPKFTCTECGKQYATSSNLSRHKQTHRSLDSQSAKKCIHCGKAYVSMPALAMHVLTHKLTHSCGICGKMFSRPWLLQGHLRSHTGEKPYGCAHCGKAFADRSNLRAHMQTHSSDKNYECSRCHKTFALKSYLNKHSESACLRDEEMLVYSSDQILCDEERSPQLNRGL